MTAPSPATPGQRRRRRHGSVRLVGRAPLRVVDVALFYGERSGGIRTYLDAKVGVRARTGRVRAPPGRARAAAARRRRRPRAAVGARRDARTATAGRSGRGRSPTSCASCEPDVVLLHDPFWAPRAGGARATRPRRVVLVHHGSLELDAAALPGPPRLYRAALGAWLRRVYARVDAVMSACDPHADTGRAATLPLRFGLDPAFYPERRCRARRSRPLRRPAEPREGRLRAARGRRALARSRGRCG